MAEEDAQSEFSFEDWAKGVGLQRKSTLILRDNDLTSESALVLLNETDIQSLGLTLGQRKLFQAAIQKIRDNTPGSSVSIPNTGVTSEQQEQQQQGNSQQQTTGNIEASLDQLLQTLTQQSAKTPGTSAQALAGNFLPSGDNTFIKDTVNCPGLASERVDLDPLVYLAAKNVEYLDIVDFVPQSCLSGGTKQDQIISSQEDIHLVLRTGAKKPKLSDINQAMYMAASCRILAHMLNNGKINPNNTAQYLSYMVKIGMLAQRYQWQSILSYDREYRKMQAAYQFPWGSDTQHLSQVYLVDKFQKRNVQNSNQATRQPEHVKREPCRLYNHSFCTYGSSCRYAHICLRCKREHPLKEHSE